jgi:hypothetical protein
VKSGIACLAALVLWSGTAAEAATAAERALAQARQAYNEGNADAAIAAATRARADARVADAAAIVLARAHLERFRTGADRQDFDDAREALGSAQPARLGPRDRIDLAVGFAEALYLEGAYGAAAETFEPLLDAAAELGLGTRERVVDWWASALDAEARLHPAPDRAQYYRRIVARMDTELSGDNGAGSASYWLAAGGRATALRADLDRLAVDGIIPERVRNPAWSARDQERAAAELQNEWERVKARWK